MTDQQEMGKPKTMEEVGVALGKRMLGGTSHLLSSGLYSDMTLQCDGHSWMVHRAILTINSGYFFKMCRGQSLESHPGYIVVDEADPAMIGSMLCFIYRGDYPDSNGSKEPLSFNVGMYAIGDKYDVPMLKALAEIKLSTALTRFTLTMTTALVQAIDIIYNTTLSSDRGLRDCILPILIKHKLVLRRNEEFMGLFKSGLADGDFAQDVMDAWTGADSDQARTGRPWYCRTCKRHGAGNEERCPSCEKRVLEF